MALFNPDELKHANNNYALIDVNSLRGTSIVNTIEERDNIPLDKRKIGGKCTIISTESSYEYFGPDLTNIEWENSSNWIIVGNTEIKANVDGSNLTLRNWQDFNTQSFVDNNTGITYYVELTGNDSNDGLTVGTAFATLERAFKQIAGQHLTNIVKFKLGLGEHSVNPNTIAKYSRDITTSGTADTGIQIEGTMSIYKTGLTITNITGRANIRTFSGVVLTDNELQGKFILQGTNYIPCGGNKGTDIFVATTAIAGTNKTIYDLGTTIKFTNRGFIPKDVNMTIDSYNIKYTTVNTADKTILLSSRYRFFTCWFDREVSTLSDRSIYSQFTRCMFGSLLNSETVLNIPIIVIANCVFINGGGRVQSKNAKFNNNNIWVNTSIGFIQESALIFGQTNVQSIIDTDGLTNNVFDAALCYDNFDTDIRIPACETYGSVRFSLRSTTVFSDKPSTNLRIFIKAYDPINYPLTFIMPTLMGKTEFPFDIERGRNIYIEGQTDQFLDEKYLYEYSVGIGGDFTTLALLSEFLEKNPVVKRVSVDVLSDYDSVTFKNLGYLEVYLNSNLPISTSVTLKVEYTKEVQISTDQIDGNRPSIRTEYCELVIISGAYFKDVRVFEGTQLSIQNSELLNETILIQCENVKSTTVDNKNIVTLSLKNANVILKENVVGSSSITNLILNEINEVLVSDAIEVPVGYENTKHFVTSETSTKWIRGTNNFVTNSEVIDLSTNQTIESGVKTFVEYPKKRTYQIGDVGPNGGIVAIINSGIYYELASTDLVGTYQFKTEQTETLNTSMLLGEGYNNTQVLIEPLTNLHPAAEACAAIGEGWFLPSAIELATAFTNLTDRKSELEITQTVYWTSSDKDSNDAYAIFTAGDGVIFGSKNVTQGVRAMITFTDSVPEPINDNEFVTKSYIKAENTSFVPYKLLTATNTQSAIEQLYEESVVDNIVLRNSASLSIDLTTKLERVNINSGTGDLNLTVSTYPLQNGNKLLIINNSRGAGVTVNIDDTTVVDGGITYSFKLLTDSVYIGDLSSAEVNYLFYFLDETNCEVRISTTEFL